MESLSGLLKFLLLSSVQVCN